MNEFFSIVKFCAPAADETVGGAVDSYVLHMPLDFMNPAVAVGAMLSMKPKKAGEEIFQKVHVVLPSEVCFQAVPL